MPNDVFNAVKPLSVLPEKQSAAKENEPRAANYEAKSQFVPELTEEQSTAKAKELRADHVNNLKNFQQVASGNRFFTLLTLFLAATARTVQGAGHFRPSELPTSMPSFSSPTIIPTTFNPSSVPTLSPTYIPTIASTLVPTEVPSESPTDHPTITSTLVPTEVPSESPTDHPTIASTLVPTEVPSESPTDHPTEGPTSSPSNPAPTSSPTNSSEVVHVHAESFSTAKSFQKESVVLPVAAAGTLAVDASIVGFGVSEVGIGSSLISAVLGTEVYYARNLHTGLVVAGSVPVFSTIGGLFGIAIAEIQNQVEGKPKVTEDGKVARAETEESWLQQALGNRRRADYGLMGAYAGAVSAGIFMATMGIAECMKKRQQREPEVGVHDIENGEEKQDEVRTPTDTSHQARVKKNRSGNKVANHEGSARI